MAKFDFSGWATKANLKCSDGRVILKDAFKHNDGKTVPLVWNHQHTGPDYVLGHALLENRDEGVYTYCTFNDTESGKTAKLLVQHGDIVALSIYANQLKQQMSNVLHGNIREVSLVFAGANPGASIVPASIAHGDDGAEVVDDEGIIYTGEELSLYHSDENEEESEDKEGDAELDEETVDEENDEEIEHADKTDEDKSDDDMTVEEMLKTFTPEQRKFVYGLLGMVMAEPKTDKTEDEDKSINHNDEGGNNSMKQNVFDKDTEVVNGGVLSHADQEAILKLAKTSGVGSFKAAVKMYLEENESLSHGIIADNEIEQLFPDFKNLNPGAPEILRPDQSWVMKVIKKIHKSPYSRIRTRQADARIADLRAKGYQKKGDEKKIMNDITLLSRTTDPQTIYVRDNIHRDDVIDIEDFDIVGYQWGVMKDAMYETLALAALVGDNRDPSDPDKIHEAHIRSILNDDELYTIHQNVDVEAMQTELQGTNTAANFGENYIYAEAMIQAALYSREQYKGTGTPDYYCAPHSVNVMLLARDLNGRRIYDSKADLAKALNVGEIVEIEQFEGRVRTLADGSKKKVHGIFVNLNDYQFGAAKGGELARFDQFDIDFNLNKYLMETRTSGALTKPKSAIVLEEDYAEEAAG